MTNREGNMSDQKQKIMGSQCLLKVSNDKRLGKEGKEEGKGERRMVDSNFLGVATRHKTSHHPSLSARMLNIFDQLYMT